MPYLSYKNVDEQKAVGQSQKTVMTWEAEKWREDNKEDDREEKKWDEDKSREKIEEEDNREKGNMEYVCTKNDWEKI